MPPITVSDADDTLGTVTITGLPGDLTNFNSGTYTASTGTWTGTAAQFNALSFTAGAQGLSSLTIAATTTGAEAGTTTESYTLTVNNPNQDNWTGGAGDGNWSTPGNWDKGVPTSTMTADLDAAGTYTVSSSGTVTIAGLISTSTATLDITGGTFTVTNFEGQGPLILSGGTFNIGSSTANCCVADAIWRDAERAWGPDGDWNDELLGAQHGHGQRCWDEQDRCAERGELYGRRDAGAGWGDERGDRCDAGA